LRVRRTRRYDAEKGCYIYHISFQGVPTQSARATQVSQVFGLHPQQETLVYDDFHLQIQEGDVVYITGESGAGKSLLLQALAKDLGEEAAIMGHQPPQGDPLLIDAVGGTFTQALKTLNAVGLGEAQLYLKRISELSEGQRHRFQLAKLVESGRRFWVCDEFLSTLDRPTARVVAYNVQKQSRRLGATLVVATGHTDLEADLQPNVRVVKGWGAKVEATRLEPQPHRCTVAEEATVEKGSRRDYEALASLHYRGGPPAFPLAYYRLVHGGEVVGVAAYQYPQRFAQGRVEAVGRQPSVHELNRSWAQVSRVIVHPNYRGAGLATKLLAESLLLQPRRHVEMVAVMALYNPFAERAGMRLIKKTRPAPGVLRALDELRRLGLEPSSLANHQETTRALEARATLEPILEALKHVGSPATYKRLSNAHTHQTWGEFHKWLKDQPIETLARVLKRLHTLSQTKAYLYWDRRWVEGGEGG